MLKYAAFALISMAGLAGSQALAAAPDRNSEIRRGFAESDRCAVEALADTKKLASCYQTAAAKAEASHADVRAFEVGLYFGACLHFDAFVRADTGLAPTNKDSAADLPYSKAQFDIVLRALEKHQKDLGVTYEDIVSSTPIIPRLRPAYVAMLNHWAAAQ